MAYGNFKYLTEEQLLIKYWVIKHLILLKIRTMLDINVTFASMAHNFFDKKTCGSGIKNENISNKELAEENSRKEITFNFYRQYLGCRSSRYAINN